MSIVKKIASAPVELFFGKDAAKRFELFFRREGRDRDPFEPNDLDETLGLVGEDEVNREILERRAMAKGMRAEEAERVAERQMKGLGREEENIEELKGRSLSLRL